jgi:hypothetical protein
LAPRSFTIGRGRGCCGAKNLKGHTYEIVVVPNLPPNGTKEKIGQHKEYRKYVLNELRRNVN